MRSLALLIAAVAALSVAQTKPDARVSIEKQIARYVQGMQKKDIKTVQSVMTSDFKAATKSGVTAEGKDVIKQLSGLFAQVKKISISCSIQSLKMENGKAHLISHNVMEVEVPDKQGNIGTIKSDSTSDEIWVPSGQTFKISYSRQLTNKVTLNGRPIKNGG